MVGSGTDTRDLHEVFEYFSAENMERIGFHETYDAFGAAANEKTVEAFERLIGFQLPEDFRYFTLSPMGGVCMLVKEELWPPPQLGDFGPFWSFHRGIKVFGLGPDIPEELDIRVKYNALNGIGFFAKLFSAKKNRANNLVPFLQVEGRKDAYCFDNQGNVILWSEDDSHARDIDGRTFSQVLLDEISGLENRLVHKRELLALLASGNMEEFMNYDRYKA